MNRKKGKNYLSFIVLILLFALPYYYKGKVIKVEGKKIVLQDNEGWQMGFDFSKHTMRLNELVIEKYEN
jgi:hypothetical protein